MAVFVWQWFFNRSVAVLKKKTTTRHVSGLPRCIICGCVSRRVTPFLIKRRHYP